MILSSSSYPTSWPEPSEIKTEFRYRCAFCTATHLYEYLVLAPVLFNAPPGWTNMNGKWICPHHLVSFKVDDKEYL